jgi:Lon protease-like protein
MERIADFPLFPLGIVALPTELVPLHIFEERYKTMIEVCLEHETEFGIVWASEDGVQEVGCACEVAEVLERLPDGRLSLIVRGTRPFRIERRQDEFVYPAGTVDFLDDADDDPGDPDAAADAHAAYGELLRQATDRDPEDDELEPLTAYEMAATIEFGPDVKQNLLSLRSETARMEQVARLLRAAIKRLDYVERAQVRAKSNGKVVFPA